MIQARREDRTGVAVVCGRVSRAGLLTLLSLPLALMAGSAAGANRAALRVESVPAGALVSVSAASSFPPDAPRTVAGETPLEKTFDFGKARRLWLAVEKRGYQPQLLEVTPDSRSVTAHLDLAPPEPGTETASGPLPAVHTLTLVRPEITVVRRGFAKEQVSEADSSAAQTAVLEAVRTAVSATYRVAAAPPAQDFDSAALKPLWRDARTVMELVDPIRLPFLAAAPRLETRAGREAARRLGEASGAQAVLLVGGNENVETKGMKAGKIGIMALGTAASYAGAYGAAVAHGDSFFTYNVYLPSFDEGTALRALLVDCRNGEVLWVNRGLWKRIDFSQLAELGPVVTELLTGLERPAAHTGQPATGGESP